MKTTIKQFTAGAFVAFLLFAGIVKAEGTEAVASRHENIESALELENWMTDESVWETNSMSFAEFDLETETTLELENWMVNDKTWNFSNNLLNEDTESVMELEGWMTDSKTWNVENANPEAELTMENWMMDNNNWK